MKPLVSILIPTYNRPRYLKQALKSALNQTYRNIEIIICDNSDNDKTQQVVNAFLSTPRGTKIKYVKNSKNIGPVANEQKCFELSSGEYINFLMDDDMLHPRKIEKMIPYMIRDNNIALVASRKQEIDRSGKRLSVKPPAVPFKKKNKKAVMIKGRKAIKTMLIDRKNHFGEPTVPLFRKKDLKHPFGTFLGHQANNSVDAASWMTLLANKNAVYLKEPLSFFRRHPDRLSKSSLSSMARISDWIVFTVIARKNGLFKDTEAFVRSIRQFKKPVLKQFPKWNRKTGGQYVDVFIMRMRLLVEICEETKGLASTGKEFKSVLHDLEKSK